VEKFLRTQAHAALSSERQDRGEKPEVVQGGGWGKEAAGDTPELPPLRGQSLASLLPSFKLILTCPASPRLFYNRLKCEKRFIPGKG